MKIRVGRGAVTFVEKKDSARFDPSHDAGGHGLDIPTNCIESAHRPADQAAVPRRVEQPDERRSFSAQRAIENIGWALDAALIYFPRDPRRGRTPEMCRWDAWRCDSRSRGPPRGSTSNSAGEFRRAFADDKKGSPGIEARAESPAMRGVCTGSGPSSIVSQTSRCDGFEMRHRPDPTTGSSRPGLGREQEVRKEKHPERKQRMKGHHGDEKERRAEVRSRG